MLDLNRACQNPSAKTLYKVTQFSLCTGFSAKTRYILRKSTGFLKAGCGPGNRYKLNRGEILRGLTALLLGP